jgi:amidase
MRDYLRWAWHRFFEQYDILLAPQNPTPAFPHDHSPQPQRTLTVEGKTRDYMEQIFWAGLVGISRLPSTVIPTGAGEEGLPIGVQIVGNAFDDRLTIQIAQELERQGFDFAAPPGFAV